jgi:hypothetical protein
MAQSEPAVMEWSNLFLNHISFPIIVGQQRKHQGGGAPSFPPSVFVII